jgi:hypothetical protein
MDRRAALLSLALVAGCATATPEPPPEAGATSVPAAAETSRPRASAGPSDWALAIVGTPFVFAFRTVVCAATAVVAGPTAGLLALSDEPRAGLVYVRDGLAQNCGPPYGVPVPISARYRTEPDVGYSPEPGVRYYPESDVGQPRPLMPDGRAGVMSP